MERKQAIQSAASTLKKMGDRLQKQTEERNKIKTSNSVKKNVSTMLSATAKWKRWKTVKVKLYFNDLWQVIMRINELNWKMNNTVSYVDEMDLMHLQTETLQKITK